MSVYVFASHALTKECNRTNPQQLCPPRPRSGSKPGTGWGPGGASAERSDGPREMQTRPPPPAPVLLVRLWPIKICLKHKDSPFQADLMAREAAFGNKTALPLHFVSRSHGFLHCLSRQVWVKGIENKDATPVEGREGQMSRLIPYFVPEIGGETPMTAGFQSG